MRSEMEAESLFWLYNNDDGDDRDDADCLDDYDCYTK